jgi:hypothetical protein
MGGRWARDRPSQMGDHHPSCSMHQWVADGPGIDCRRWAIITHLKGCIDGRRMGHCIVRWDMTAYLAHQQTQTMDQNGRYEVYVYPSLVSVIHASAQLNRLANFLLSDPSVKNLNYISILGAVMLTCTPEAAGIQSHCPGGTFLCLCEINIFIFTCTVLAMGTKTSTCA